MKTWADFYDYIIPVLPGVTTDVVDLHLRNAAIEFCNETGVADYEAEPITLQEGVSQYSVLLPGADYNVARIKSASLDNRVIEPTTPDQLDNNHYGWKDIIGTPLTYFMVDPYTVRVFPIPDKSGELLNLTYTLRPNRDATGIDDYIFERYVEGICHGAIMRLSMMPAKPWTNLEQAQGAGIMFRAAKRDATIEVNKSFTRAKLQVRLRRVM